MLKCFVSEAGLWSPKVGLAKMLSASVLYMVTMCKDHIKIPSYEKDLYFLRNSVLFCILGINKQPTINRARVIISVFLSENAVIYKWSTHPFSRSTFPSGFSGLKLGATIC